jgi:hypothetical protein
VTGRLIGYARVSTEQQGTDPQLDDLHAAGCDVVREEHDSGADRTRPVLASLLREIRPGETLVVVRLDRLARSVSHLLDVIESWNATDKAGLRTARRPALVRARRSARARSPGTWSENMPCDVVVSIGSRKLRKWAPLGSSGSSSRAKFGLHP